MQRGGEPSLPGNPAAISLKDLGQWFCVPLFRMVCLFQAKHALLSLQNGEECQEEFPSHVAILYRHDAELPGMGSSAL
jgi:hypothetical protein